MDCLKAHTVYCLLASKLFSCSPAISKELGIWNSYLEMILLIIEFEIVNDYESKQKKTVKLFALWIHLYSQWKVIRQYEQSGCDCAADNSPLVRPSFPPSSLPSFFFLYVRPIIFTSILIWPSTRASGHIHHQNIQFLCFVFAFNASPSLLRDMRRNLPSIQLRLHPQR